MQEIAGEKAGIFKGGVPAYTVPQPPEAMRALEASNYPLLLETLICTARLQLGVACNYTSDCLRRPLNEANLMAQEAAHRMGISLSVTRSLSDFTNTAQQPLALKMAGAHQEQNASLAVALAASWEASERGGFLLKRASRASASLPNGTTALSNGHDRTHERSHGPGDAAGEPGPAMAHAAAVQAGCLPAPYITGLRNVFWPGRNQVQSSLAGGDCRLHAGHLAHQHMLDIVRMRLERQLQG